MLRVVVGVQIAYLIVALFVVWQRREDRVEARGAAPPAPAAPVATSTRALAESRAMSPPIPRTQVVAGCLLPKLGGERAQLWYCLVRGRCATERVNPPDETGWDYLGYHAACLGAGGRAEEAASRLAGAPAIDRARATSVVFELFREQAEAGEPRAGPMMELVLAHQAANPAASYLAGLVYAKSGDRARASRHMARYLALRPDADHAGAVARAIVGGGGAP